LSQKLIQSQTELDWKGCITHFFNQKLDITETSIKVHMAFTPVDFLPEGPDFPPGPVPSLTYLCTSTGKEYEYNEILPGLLKYYFFSRIFTHLLYKIFYGDKVFMCVLNSAPGGIIVPG